MRVVGESFLQLSKHSSVRSFYKSVHVLKLLRQNLFYIIIPPLWNLTYIYRE